MISDHQIGQMLQAQYGAPAYIRRARRVEDALEELIARGRHQREPWLLMVRLHLGTLFALAADNNLLQELLDDEQIKCLCRLHQELAPELRAPPAPAKSVRPLRRTLADLDASIERFNDRWLACLPGVDLTEINEVRDNYNRYYLLEKECAVRSARLARQGFRPLEPCTTDELLVHLPCLPRIRPRTP